METKSIAWDSGGGYIRLTYTGSGSGTISVESDVNNLGTARSKVITVSTTQGGVVTKNLTVNQAACPFPVGDVKNFSYTGSVQSVLLPAGSYKLQCWGAQGGSNAAASSYGITAKAGGKGGYSEGVLTLSSPTTVYIFVGGQGSSSGNGGWNGGGGGTGSSSYNSGNTNGISRCGGGGGATDIALTTSSMSYSSYRTNRSSASLLSRIIVAGGGSGGAMCYTAATTTNTTTITNLSTNTTLFPYSNNTWVFGGNPGASGAYNGHEMSVSSYRGQTMTVYPNSGSGRFECIIYKTAATSGGTVDYASGTTRWALHTSTGETKSITIPSDANYVYFTTQAGSMDRTPSKVTFTKTTTTTSNNSQVGYVGGGTSGGGYSSTYQGRQSAAGSNGGFGYGANQQASGNRYTAGCGGGGWYGGGSNTSDSSDTYIKYSGGGSGFVNTAASAGNRPSGYTGSQLDSGTTYAGDTSFPSTSGSTETGHAGNGYAKITRLS